jgi:aspartokinase
VIIPLVVGTNVRSSISFSLNVTANTVSNVKFGRRKLIRELMATYRSIDTHQVKADGAPFAVEIPVFDIWLIGYVNVQNELELIATIDLPLRDMVVSRGERISEAAMFRMAIMAQQYNGLPN